MSDIAIENTPNANLITETNTSKFSKVYNSFLVFLPVILLFALIIMIYSTYFFAYLLVLIRGSTYSKNEYPFLNTTNQTSAHIKGIVLLSLSGSMLFLLIISMIRTIFMDPGFFLDPTKLEIKIVMKNSSFQSKQQKHQNIKKEKILNSLEEVAMENEEGEENDLKKNDKKSNF